MFDAQDHTASGLPLKGVYTAEDVAGISFEEIGLPGEYPFVRGPYPRCIAAGPGRCARLPVMAPLPIRTNDSAICWRTDRPDSPWTSTCRPLWDTTPMICPRKARLDVRG